MRYGRTQLPDTAGAIPTSSGPLFVRSLRCVRSHRAAGFSLIPGSGSENHLITSSPRPSWVRLDHAATLAASLWLPSKEASRFRGDAAPIATPSVVLECKMGFLWILHSH